MTQSDTDDIRTLASVLAESGEGADTNTAIILRTICGLRSTGDERRLMHLMAVAQQLAIEARAEMIALTN